MLKGYLTTMQSIGKINSCIVKKMNLFCEYYSIKNNQK